MILSRFDKHIYIDRGIISMKNSFEELILNDDAGCGQNRHQQLHASLRSGKIITPKDSKLFSESEMNNARRICEEALNSVKERTYYINNENDSLFALPSGNWAYDAPNEYLKLFLRVSQCKKLDIQNLRALCNVFSGYNLYEVKDSKGLSCSNQVFSYLIDEVIRDKLTKNNTFFINEWLYITEGLPKKYLFKPPMLFGECGHLINDIIVNSDTNAYQERINLLYLSGIIQYIEKIICSKNNFFICEIGGGYGALAYWFKKTFPGCTYTIIDLPESLLFSRLYLSLSIQDIDTSYGLGIVEHGIQFVPNYMAEKINNSFDLVINTLSMSEMTLYQVQKYTDLIKNRWLKKSGLFFEQNQDNTHIGLLNAQEIFHGEFLERKSLGRSKNGFSNIWSNYKIELEDNFMIRHYSKRAYLLEDFCEFNIVQYGNKYFCLRKSLGPTDITQLANQDIIPDIFYGKTLEEVKEKANSLKVATEF